MARRTPSADRHCCASGSSPSPTRWAPTSTSGSDRGAAVLHLVRGDEVVAALALEDAIRPEARAAVEELRQLGIDVAMITGDARQVADSRRP